MKFMPGCKCCCKLCVEVVLCRTDNVAPGDLAPPTTIKLVDPHNPYDIIGQCTSTNQVKSVAVTAGGTVYTSIPTVGFTDTSGTGATAVAVMQLDGATPAAAGKNYKAGDNLRVSGGVSASVGALVVTSVDANGGITGLSPASLARGQFTVLPSDPATLTGGSGTGATAHLTWSVLAVNVTEGGGGYTVKPGPTVTFSGGGAATAATATATTANRCCFAVPRSGSYQVQWSSPGHLGSGSGFPGGQVGKKTIQITCPGTNTTQVTLYPTTVDVRVSVAATCDPPGGPPSATYPIYVDIVQHAPGNYAVRLTFTSTAPQTITVPVDATTAYTVTWSSPGFISQAYEAGVTDWLHVPTLIVCRDGGWINASGLEWQDDSQFFWPNLPCVGAPPATIQVTLDGDADVWGPSAGTTITLALSYIMTGSRITGFKYEGNFVGPQNQGRTLVTSFPEGSCSPSFGGSAFSVLDANGQYVIGSTSASGTICPIMGSATLTGTVPTPQGAHFTSAGLTYSQ